MEVVHAHCAGLDVHQATVVATVRVPAPDGTRRAVTETFGTMTPDLLALREWLQGYGVTQVALESTGVYWKPVYYVLEDAFALLLINMHALKRVPGRKTDVQDSAWLAQLLECGLLRASFVPPPAIRELRDLSRYRTQQVHDRAREVNRLCKVLEDAGLKLTTVMSDVMGASPTPDSSGARNTISAYLEFAVPLVSPEMDVPLMRSLDLQLAGRMEAYQGFSTVAKPKVALSWYPVRNLQLRGSWSQGFRAPNLPQLFENGIQRSNTRTDWILSPPSPRFPCTT